MANPNGTPIWFEYLGGDLDAAKAFYGDVVGWSIADSGMGSADGMTYLIASAPDGDNVAGMMSNPMADMPPTWLIYFGTADVDAAVEAMTAAGAAVQMPATTMEGVGRMAMLADPQGIPFYVMRGASDEDSRAFQDYRKGDVTGHGVWVELASPDPKAAIAFYTGQLGIVQDGAMPMGDLGDYSFIHAGGTGIGAIMGVVMNARPGWQPYFGADDIDAAVARLKAAGGTLIQGPDQIPGGSYVVVAEDHAGARFGFSGPRKEA